MGYAYLMRMLDVTTEAEFLQEPSFRLHHLILEGDVVIVQDDRGYHPENFNKISQFKGLYDLLKKPPYLRKPSLVTW